MSQILHNYLQSNPSLLALPIFLLPSMRFKMKRRMTTIIGTERPSNRQRLLKTRSPDPWSLSPQVSSSKLMKMTIILQITTAQMIITTMYSLK
jgi:hypothetical protein